MTRRLIVEGLALLALLLASWFGLRQVDWMALFHVQELSEKSSQKLGELYWEFFKTSEQEVQDTTAVQGLTKIVDRLCERNGIAKGQIRLHILKKEEINAFALPGDRIVVFSGLIRDAEGPCELAGVLSHELAHTQLGHVEKKLAGEMGITVLLQATTGSKAAEVIRETAKRLTSTAFERSIEKEADLKAVDYMSHAGIPPKCLADFLSKMARHSKGKDMKIMTWISTHPDPEERAKYILEHPVNMQTQTEPLLTEGEWDEIRKAVGQ